MIRSLSSLAAAARRSLSPPSLRLCASVSLCLAAAILLQPAPSDAQEWHSSLYLGNGGVWRQRIRVTLRNDGDQEAAGTPVALRVGKGDGEADLAGRPASEVRVCDAHGVEMLFAISDPAGRPVTREAIPAGSTLTLPAECPAHGTADYFVYFDNPSAWAVPDFLKAGRGLVNGGVEEGAGDTPVAWVHDTQDDQHRTFWSTEAPHSGKHCLKTVVAEGAEPTWIATRQQGIPIVGGAKYTMRAWVKAQNARGSIGWYIHVGSRENSMLLSPMLLAGEGTYGWKEVTAEFTAPKEATVADLGTVLRGTGTAWFDDVSLECADKPALSARAAKPEALSLREMGAPAAWPAGAWQHRVPVKVVNVSDKAQDAGLVCVDLAPIAARLRGKMNAAATRVMDGARAVPHFQVGDLLLFEGGAPAHTARTYYVYLSTQPGAKTAASLGYAALLASPRNLAKNPSFESGDDQPDAWPGGAEGQRPAGVTMGFDQPGLFGRRCARISIPHDAKPAWTGWRQDVPVKPGKTYLLGAWLKTEDIRDGSVQLHVHYRNATGELCKSPQMGGAGPALSGTNDWTLLSGIFTMPEDIATFQLHLTMLATGTLWHDGVVLTEVTPGTPGQMEGRRVPAGSRLAVWPVNAVVKVFQDDPAPAKLSAARITAARNEKEPLQLAVRSATALKEVRVEVVPPANAKGAKLPAPEVAVVGYVPIDHATNYYSANSPEWHRKFPTSSAACDGWPGMWPDPLLPRSSFSLPANQTQPFWVTVSVPAGAAPGDYRGKVRLTAAGKLLKEVPFTVHVWNFTLPEERHLKAIFDTRQNGGMWAVPGQSREQTRQAFWRFEAAHRVCPDRIQPEPVLRYENGKVVSDFTEYDKAAEYYFNALKMPHTYTPSCFYLFGWGHPPAEKFGQAPYVGKYPYDDVDRGKLRPEYKQAYQACLKAYWEHMKAKGWADRVTLYISDEPFYSKPAIIAQMKALCRMIQEVDPAIPIYSSTWAHVPEWDGSLTVWGLGHYGIVKPEKLAALPATGARLWYTTDGQMCTDTPYCGVERLLPHYCFKYGAQAYEFWGIDWLTYDPYEFGWHSYISQSEEPGKTTWVRYPNGDGFLAYPGKPIGHAGPVSSVRLEQAREGMEDYEYLYTLRDLVAKAKAAGRDASAGEEALARASRLVTIPNAGGRYSSKILPDPDAVFTVKEAVARAIERMGK